MSRTQNNRKLKETSRRHLLRYGGAAAGLALAGTLAYQFRAITPARFPSHPLRASSTWAPTLLVVYGSMMGSTGIQAAEMENVAQAAGWSTRLARVDEQPDPAAFDAVIMGSAIRAGSWLPEMLDWAQRSEAAILARPHALFQCSMRCAGLRRDQPDHGLTEADTAALKSDLDALHAAAPGLADAPIAFFGGVLDYDRLTPPLRIGYPIVSGSLMSGDYSRPEQNRAYAETVLNGPDFKALVKS
ncbi:flavodoxin domain-containing protein [Paracoccus sp. (in: a-proteobacteria)]|uniref:flavodoxin domain-containing protein n=1 Tax=Paracoccus sp. TaxID=267 RepID=UPI003A84F8E8